MVNVVFCASRTLGQKALGSAGAIIYPSNNDWNDFGFRLIVSVDLVNGDGKVLQVSGDPKLYIKGETKSSSVLSALGSTVIVNPGLINDSPFIMAFSSKDEYSKVLAHMGLEDGIKALVLMRDAAAMREFNSSDVYFERFMEDSVFHDSLLRGRRSYLAFLGLSKICQSIRAGELPPLRALEFAEGVSGGRNIISLGFADGIFGRDSISVFIGPNGVGKTRLLIDLARGALSGVLPAENGVRSNEGVEGVSSVLVLTHEVARWEEVAKLGARVKSIAIQGVSWIESTSHLFDLVRSSGVDRGRFDWDEIRAILRSDLPIDGLHFPTLDGQDVPWSYYAGAVGAASPAVNVNLDRTSGPIFRDENGGVFELSSGQKAILIFFIRFFSSVERRSLVIIDEPETHLHPTYIDKLVHSLDDALNQMGAAGVVATHSPYVVRNVSKDNVVVLSPGDGDGGTVEFRNPTFQTRWGDIQRISEFVFEVGVLDVPLLRERMSQYLSANSERGRDWLRSQALRAMGLDGLSVLEAMMEGGDADVSRTG